MIKSSLLDKAKRELALVVREMDTADSNSDILACHIQQVIEKCLKNLLMLKGIEYPKVHSISVLLRCLGDKELDGVIRLYASAITSFEAEARYSDLFFLSVEELEMFIDICNKVVQYTDTAEKEFMQGITEEFS